VRSKWETWAEIQEVPTHRCQSVGEQIQWAVMLRVIHKVLHRLYDEITPMLRRGTIDHHQGYLTYLHSKEQVSAKQRALLHRLRDSFDSIRDIIILQIKIESTAV
jgi:hypothetical protein